MKRKINKAVAMIAAVTSILSSNALGIGSFAEDRNATLADNLDEIVLSDDISSEDFEVLMEMITAVQSDSDPFTFADYDYYAPLAISPTTHYLAALAEEGSEIESCDIYFFLNTNIVNTGYLNNSLFKIGTDYASSSSLGTATATNASSSVRRIAVPFSTTVTSAPSTSELFTYKLGTFSGAVQNENKLHKYTRRYESVITTVLESSEDCMFEKCVYSLGDVDRDGDVDSEDATLVLKYRVGLGSGGALDEAAFRLAADVNLDGTVDIMDVILINKYVLGSATL